MIKKNWRYKKAVNMFFHSLRKYPKVLKILIKIVWLLRYIFRGLSPPKPDSAGGILVNKSYKVILAANPKVASSSLKKYFLNELPSSDIFISAAIRDLETLIDTSEQNYYSFAIVRNSWERVYSCWKDKISNKDKFADIFIITRYKSLYPGMPFEDFVDWLCNEKEGSDQFADRHWISQSELLDIKPKDLNYSKIIELKNLNKEFNEIISELKLPSVFNEYANETKQPNAYIFSPEIINKIEKRYARDIKKYNFTPPNIFTNDK